MSKINQNFIEKLSNKVIVFLFILGAIASLLFSIAGYLGKFNLLFELTCHFRVQYLLIAIVTLIFFALIKRYKWLLIITCSCIAINLIEIVPWYLPQPPVLTDNLTQIRLIVANVNIGNLDYSKIVDFITKEKPDIVALLEVDRRWLTALKPINALLPYTISKPRNDPFGIAIYSALPLSNTSIEFLGDLEIPTLVADVTKNNRVISLVATHPLPPLNQSYFFLRNRQLEELAKYVNDRENPVAVLGDLNLTMWSPFYRELVRASGLKNSRYGYGVLPTWPTGLPFLYIPLDHCLVDENIQVINTKIGENVGSDHLPVITDVAF